MLKAFIFDFDGVIVDSEKYWDSLLEEAFKERIPQFKHETLSRMMGQSAHGVVDLLNAEYNLNFTFESYIAMIDTQVMDVYLKKCELMPGLLDLVKRLQSQGVPQAIASSSQRKWVQASVDHFEIRSYFPVIVTGDDAPGRAKPLPDLYLLAAEKLEVDPAQCIAIEDSKNGTISAKAAGMVCIGLRSDMNPSQDLSAADWVTEDMNQITEEKLHELLG
jgi:HAD superfamily hydrolase (TIGR01509 family)